MKNGKYSNKRRGVATKTLVLALSLVLIVGCVVGGTLAWLTDTTANVTNTFTVGNIDIDLAETTGTSYKIVPGGITAKDPKVTVTGGSEACWLFIKVVDENNTIVDPSNNNKIVDWTVDSGWTAVPGHSGYWYRSVGTSAQDQVFNVLASGTPTDGTTGTNGVVIFSSAVTKAMVDTLNTNSPAIIITSAAIQSDNIATVTDAWSNLPSAFTA
ncbi:MAG: SipW-dependent-type signal peptide-containing protein [Limosilactobacillus sp.]